MSTSSRRRYSDEEKATALLKLDANGGNLSRTSADTGIPIPTLALWRNGRAAGNAVGSGVTEAITDLCNGKRKPLADQLEEIAYQCAGLLPGKLKTASVREVVGALSQSVEKMRLLRNLPTTIQGAVEATAEEEIDAEEAAIVARVTERMTQQAPAALN